jgi:5'-nucleotidase
VGAALTAANFGGRGLAVSIDVVSKLVHEQGGNGAAAGEVPAQDRAGDRAVAEVVEAPDDVSRGEAAGTVLDSGSPAHWDTAAEVAAAAVDWLIAAPKGTVLNLNVPDLPADRLAGARAASLAPFGTVRSTVVESAEDGGRLQLELRPTTVDLPPGCDTALVAEGYVAVSAITGVQVDEGVDVGDVLAAVVAEARSPA